MAIDIVARALAVSGKQNLENYYTKTESDGRYVKSSENFVKAFTIPNGASTGTLTADAKQKLCNPDGHNYYVYDDTSEMILKYSFNEEDEIIQYKAIYLVNDKAYDITMQILPSNGSWRRSQTVLNGATANPTLTGTEAELTGLKVGGTNYKIPVTKNYVDDNFVKSVASTTNHYSVYGIGNNKDITIILAENPTTQAVAQYSNVGTLRTNTPTNDNDCANKKYVDDGFVKKQTGEINKLYSIDSTGQDNVLGYSQSPANSAVVQYTSSGTVRTNDPISKLDSVNKLYLEFNAPSLKNYCSIIPSNGNADDYTTAGTYVCDAYSTTLVNFPTEFKAGRLYVLYGTQASNYPIQIAIPYNSSSLYIRNRFENNWSAWGKLATTSDINNKKVFSVTIYEAGD